MNHRLYLRRIELDFTVAEVAELTGIAETTIRRIESGDTTYKVNIDTAMTLAKGLDVQLHTLFEPIELSDLGRPPKTGGSLHRGLSSGVICMTCRLEIPLAHGNNCEECAA